MKYHVKSLTTFTLILSLICPIAAAANRNPAVKNTLAQSTTTKNGQAQANRLLQQGIKQANTKQLDAALQSLQQALNIYQQIKDSAGQGQTLQKLGDVYAAKKDSSKSIAAYEQSLVIARQINNRDLEARSLLNLGVVYNSIKKYDKALEFLPQSWQIAQNINSRELQLQSLIQLFEAYNAQGNTAKAQEYQQQLATNFGEVIKYVVALQSYNQISVLTQQKQYQKAIELGQQVLEFFQTNKLNNDDSKLLISLSGINDSSIKPELLQKTLQLAVMVQLIQTYDAVADYPKIIQLGEQLLTSVRNLNADEWTILANISGQQQSNSLAEFKKLSEMGVLWLLAKSHDISGEYNKAIPLAQQAIQISRELKNPEYEANGLLTLASASKSLAVTDAEHRQALELAEQALKIAKNIKNPEIESDALNAIADIYSNLDEYQKTIEFASKSLELAKKSQDPAATVKPLLTLSSTYISLGNYQKSSELSQEALTIARKIKQIPLIEATSMLYWTFNQFIQGDYQKTIASSQEGLNLVPQINIPYYQQQFLMLNNLFLGIGYGGLNDNQKALDYIQKSVQIARNAQDAKSEAQMLVYLGGFYRRAKQYQQGIDAYNQAATIADKLNYSGNRAILYAGLARIYRDLKQQTTAIAYYQKAINDIEKVREKNRGLSRDLQTSFLQSVQDADRTNIADIYREYANLLLSQNRSLEASQVLELLKVQELSEFTNNNRVANLPKPMGQTPTEAKLIKNYGSLIAFGQKFDECQKNNCGEKTKLADERDALISEFNQKIENLEKNVRDRLSKDRGNLDTQDLRSIGKKIVESQPGTVLINVFVVEDKTWLLWVSKGGVVKSVEVSVGEPKIRETVNKFRKLLQNPSSDINEVKATGKQLYDWLIKPLEPELKANKIENLVFSLDRAARYIPISALFDGKQYLVENYNISTVLSAGLTDTDSRLPAGTANTKVLGLGLSKAVPGFNALPNVPAELDAIIRQKPSDKNGIYPGQEYLNQAFDYRTLRDNLKGHNILHIATHGVFVPGKQDDSYLVLGTGEKLPIPKIDNLEDLSDVHLVVLSACETALGETAKDGLEIPGVSFYFLNRRAKAVMASLWLVDDASTSLLMQQFYANLAKDSHPTKAQALRQAQLSLLRSNSSANSNVERGAINVEAVPGAPTTPKRNLTNFTHPYYWAPFILMGNGW
ncbi:CHAT domain-containing protein [Nostoc linckia FACHB-104]|nr:CHAT domain-containing protein [Nostoc linckia FACHB-104]